MARAIVTSSHRPSQRIRSFIKDLASTFKEFARINRGKMTLDELAQYMFTYNVDYALIVNAYRGNPGSIDVYVLDESSMALVKVARLWISGVRLSREGRVDQCMFGKVAIDPSRCFKDPCFRLADLLARITSGNIDVGRSRSSGRVTVMDRGKQIYIKFMKENGEECGPFIKISKIAFYQRDQHRSKE